MKKISFSLLILLFSILSFSQTFTIISDVNKSGYDDYNSLGCINNKIYKLIDKTSGKYLLNKINVDDFSVSFSKEFNINNDDWVLSKGMHDSKIFILTENRNQEKNINQLFYYQFDTNANVKINRQYLCDYSFNIQNNFLSEDKSSLLLTGEEDGKLAFTLVNIDSVKIIGKDKISVSDNIHIPQLITAYTSFDKTKILFAINSFVKKSSWQKGMKWWNTNLILYDVKDKSSTSFPLDDSNNVVLNNILFSEKNNKVVVAGQYTENLKRMLKHEPADDDMPETFKGFYLNNIDLENKKLIYHKKDTIWSDYLMHYSNGYNKIPDNNEFTKYLALDFTFFENDNINFICKWTAHKQIIYNGQYSSTFYGYFLSIPIFKINSNGKILWRKKIIFNAGIDDNDYKNHFSFLHNNKLILIYPDARGNLDITNEEYERIKNNDYKRPSYDGYGIPKNMVTSITSISLSDGNIERKIISNEMNNYKILPNKSFWSPETKQLIIFLEAEYPKFKKVKIQFH